LAPKQALRAALEGSTAIVLALVAGCAMSRRPDVDGGTIDKPPDVGVEAAAELVSRSRGMRCGRRVDPLSAQSSS
jgi:hypothetical protein